MELQLSEERYNHNMLDNELQMLISQTERAQKGPRREFTIQEMYNIDKRDFTSWGLPGYEVKKKYFESPAKQEQGSQQLSKTKNKQQGRSSYLEFVQKISANKPGPGRYDIPSQFQSSSKDKERKLRVLAKNSMMDQIERNAKLRPMPGPGAYFQKSKKEVDAELAASRKMKKGSFLEKLIFLDEAQVKSNETPGPGAYQPHFIRTPVHLVKLTPKQQLIADKEFATFQKKLQDSYCSPNMRTYSPEPASFLTFNRIQKQREQAAKDGIKDKRSFFGKELRFADKSKTKSNTYVNPPGPSHYNTKIVWPGKIDKKVKEESKSVNWDKISQGVSLSIYYEK